MSLLNQSKNFLIVGTINFLITNSTLQLLLVYNSIWISTFLSQLLNLIIGYFAYKKYVFKQYRIYKRSIFYYLILATFSWYLNAKLISTFAYHFNLSPNIGALINIPLLTLLSFFVQKFFIFK